MIEETRIIYSEELVKKLTLEYFNGDTLATDVWIKKYCLKDENNLYEASPVDMHYRIAGELARIEAKYPNGLTENEIFETLNGFNRIIPGGSPMAGIGNDLQVVSLSNCFVVGNDGASDSYGGILKVDQDIVQLEKRRGGVGTDLSHIRPAGSPVKNSAITSTGVVPFMERYSNTTKEVAQDGRRGALMLSINVGHPDAEAFIDAKLTQGKVTGANVSVKITDEFMEAVINDRAYIQRFPINLFGIKEAASHLLKLEEKLEKSPINTTINVNDDSGKMIGMIKKVNAKKIWKKIVYNAWKSAEPGILFWDTIIKESIPDSYKAFGFKTISTNPCFSGKEKLLTADGNKTFEELSKFEIIEIINAVGHRVPSKVWCSGEKETINLHDTQGNVMTCTPEQIWKNIKGAEIEAKDLKGEKLLPFIYDNPHDELFLKLGFIQGDGNLGRLKSSAHKGLEVNIGANDEDVLNLFKQKRETPNQRKFYVNDYTEICHELGFSGESLPERNLPSTIENWDSEEQLSFLSGLFSANGSVVANYRISFKSTNETLIHELQSLLKKFDIDSYYTTNKSKKVLFSNGEYLCKESYDLNIGKYYDLIKFYNKINFIHAYKKNKLFYTIINRSPKITKITNSGVIRVYDFTEPETNWGVVNGCISHNCGEIPLCAYDSCRLLSLNLYGYVINPFKPNAIFNHDLFSHDVKIAMRYMDDIIDLEVEKINAILGKIKSDPEDEFIKLYEINLWNEIMKKTIEGRRTGLGVTAMGDMLAALGYRYGTDKANEFAEFVQKELKLNAYESSVIMAEERGAFPIYDSKLEENNPFILRIKDEAPDLYARMIKSGRRNIALLTIAPTGSMSILTQTTSGCEPVFLVSYKRRRKINPQEKDARVDFVDAEGISWSEYPVFHHKFITWLEANDYDLNVIMSMTSQQIDEIVKKSPYYKATSNDVDWVKKVEMQGMLQSNIDHSISVTVNLPADATEEMVSNVYETAWRVGCKGITVYRDGSRDGVLISDSDKKEKEHQEKFHDTHAPKRPKRVKGEIVRFQNNNEKWVSVVGFLDGRPYEIFTGLLSNGLSNIPTNVKDCEIVKNIFEVEDINELGEYVKVRKKRYDIEYIDADSKKQIATGLSHIFNPEYWNYAKLFSGMLRHGMPLVYVHELIESMNLNDATLNTWKNGVARVIKRYIKDGVKGKGTCLVCGSTHLEYIEGCLTCKGCGSSACS